MSNILSGGIPWQTGVTYFRKEMAEYTHKAMKNQYQQPVKAGKRKFNALSASSFLGCGVSPFQQ